jgi:hypothetical protein
MYSRPPPSTTTSRRNARAHRNGAGDGGPEEERDQAALQPRAPDLTVGTLTRWRPLDRRKRVRLTAARGADFSSHSRTAQSAGRALRIRTQPSALVAGNGAPRSANAPQRASEGRGEQAGVKKALYQFERWPREPRRAEASAGLVAARATHSFPFAIVAHHERRSSANAPQRAGGARRNGAMSSAV